MKYTIKDYQDVGKRLKERLDLETEVVAIKFIKNVSEIPDGFLRPLKDTGKKMTLCMAMTAARREGKNVSITVDDNPCIPVSVAQGWSWVSPIALILSQVENKWQKNALGMIRVNNARLRIGGIMAQLPFSQLLGHKGFLVSPLSGTPFIPDTVVIYGYPEQLTHVAQSLSWEGKYVPRGVETGFGDSCWAAGFMPMKSKKPVFTLLGMGDRGVARAKKYEAAIGIPGKLVFYLNGNLFKAGGEHNLKHYIENPPVKIDENMLPGWQNVRKLLDKNNFLRTVENF
jgi:uncharacterized protein (DUF169 family)